MTGREICRMSGTAGSVGQKRKRASPQCGEARCESEGTRESYLTFTLTIAVVQQQPVAPPPFSE